MEQPILFLKTIDKMKLLLALVFFLVNIFQGSSMALEGDCKDQLQPTSEELSQAVFDFQNNDRGNRFDAYNKILLSTFNCPPGSRAGLFIDHFPAKSNTTYERITSSLGKPDFRFITDEDTKNWLGEGTDAAYYYLGMVKADANPNRPEHYFYYAAIVLNNGEPESAAVVYFRERIEYQFPKVSNRQLITTRMELTSETTSVFGINLGDSLSQAVMNAKNSGITTTRNKYDKWPPAITSHNIYGALDHSDGAKYIRVTAMNDKIYSIYGQMRNQNLFTQLQHKLENEMKIKPSKKKSKHLYKVHTPDRETTVMLYNYGPDSQTGTSMIGIKDDNMAKAAKEEKDKFLSAVKH